VKQLQITILLSLFALFVAPTAYAVSVQGLFSVQIPVETRDREERLEAIKEGMRLVLVRITGDGSIAQNPEVNDVIRGAAGYVQRFSYAPAEENYELKIDFDETRLTKNLANRGLPVWGTERPSVLSWVVVSQGSSRFMLGERDGKKEREIMNLAAEDRGIPMIFPVLDVEDRNKVRVGDIVGGFYDTVDSASERYAADAILIGRVQRQSGQWLGRWRLKEAEQTVVFESEGRDIDTVLTQGTNGAASYLASWHATQGFSDQSETVKVNVDAINNLTDYIRVRDYLKGFDTVSDVTPVVVAPPQLKLRISMRGSARNLQRLIMLGDTLLPAEAPVPEGAVLPEGGTDAVPVTQAQNELFYRLGQ
jgi:hypothetical protein